MYSELAEASPLKSERIPKGIDIVCIRELTGGIYFGQPKSTYEEAGETVALDTMIYKTSEIERIAQVAIDTAKNRQRKVCSVDKANVLETSVLWRKTVTDYFKKHAPEIELSHMYVDNAAMQLARAQTNLMCSSPKICLETYFLMRWASFVVLSACSHPSLGASKNSIGLPFGLYEPSGGTAPDIAGKGIANPCAQILSAAMMLRYNFGENEAAETIEKAVEKAVTSGSRTGDIAFGSKALSTKEMSEAILHSI